MTLVTGFSFVEAFILPRLATESPAFVAGLLGMFSSVPSPVDLGILPTLWNIQGPMYILGPLLFGIAIFRAHILSRWAAVLLALSGPMAAVMSQLGHPIDRIAAVPMGIALAWLGYSLLSERRAPASEPVPGMGSPRLSQTVAE
jgi:hypothetical protein